MISQPQDTAHDDDEAPTLVEILLEEAHAEESCRAAPLYDKAAAAGGPAIYIEAGDRFSDDDDEKSAIGFYRKAAIAGYYFGYAKMAVSYWTLQNFSDEHRCWVKFVDAFEQDSDHSKLASQREPLLYFIEWYFVGRFHANGQSMVDYARGRIEDDDVDDGTNWMEYLKRGGINESLISRIKDALLKVLDDTGEESGRPLNSEEVRQYLTCGVWPHSSPTASGVADDLKP